LTFGVWVLGLSVALSGPELSLTNGAAALLAVTQTPKARAPTVSPLKMSRFARAIAHAR
jgi:hypothetical protein